MSFSGVDALINSRIKLSNFSELNDPYECKLGSDVELLGERISSMFHELPLKISSFSADPNNLALWSHYADNHKGFCISLELDNLKDGVWLERVEYLDSRIQVEDIGDYADYEGIELYKLMSKRKSKDWEYEHEVRLLAIALDYYNITNNDVKEIYLGKDMPHQFKQIIYKVWHDVYESSGTLLYESTIDPKLYKMYYKPLKKYDINLGIMGDKQFTMLAAYDEILNKSPNKR